MARISEMKMTLTSLPEGVLRAVIVSVPKEPNKLLRDAGDYRDKYWSQLEPYRGRVRRLDLIVDSTGGAAKSAIGLVSALSRLNAPEGRVLIDGSCGSAATLVAFFWEAPVWITARSTVYIHQPVRRRYLFRNGEWSQTDAKRPRDPAVSAIAGLLKAAYRRKTHARRKQIAQWMDAGTRFTPQEAVDVGFCDGIMTRYGFESLE